ncbi:MAG: hypothetical protein C7B47_15530 [Sulfobacillus thermosulfidooxidans]|uniref:Uncharacterized protein n=1 Tax=Sulfobacillus thermosulfidooxidans TaxID=28034 RepID=A0A2T2WP74_SULTH|nr:MAG: hypothetical protein C7B47_15530 [Sulfobacillus thermosulfidooxidans]
MQYAKDPIQEVVCEFWFRPVESFDMTVPGQFYEKIQHEYPDRRTIRAVEPMFSQLGSQLGSLQRHGLEVVDYLEFGSNQNQFRIQWSPNKIALLVSAPYPCTNEGR